MTPSNLEFPGISAVSIHLALDKRFIRSQNGSDYTPQPVVLTKFRNPGKNQRAEIFGVIWGSSSNRRKFTVTL